jgi:NAD(P)-dependent dehydrogenase (short-subunit alcohol dehydrogenase family)
MLDLSNKTIWITGGNRGIGLALTKELADLKANIVITASTKESAEKAKEAVKGYPNVYVYQCDMQSAEQISECYNYIKSKFGRLDSLINNAGIFLANSVLNSKLEDFDKTMSVNLRGPYLCVKAVLADMIENQSGVIINTVSVVSKFVYQFSADYAASKAGLEAFANVLRAEVRQHGIKVINVFPGATATEIWNPKSLAKLESKMMSAKDVAIVMKDALVQALYTGAAVEEIVIRPVQGDI